MRERWKRKGSIILDSFLDGNGKNDKEGGRDYSEFVPGWEGDPVLGREFGAEDLGSARVETKAYGSFHAHFDSQLALLSQLQLSARRHPLSFFQTLAPSAQTKTRGTGTVAAYCLLHREE